MTAELNALHHVIAQIVMPTRLQVVQREAISRLQKETHLSVTHRAPTRAAPGRAATVSVVVKN